MIFKILDLRLGLHLRYCAFLLLLSLSTFGFAQTQKGDDVVHLNYADLYHRYLKDGITYQRLSGKVQMLHNNTLMLCDTAVWDQQNGIIDAKGNIQIIQDQTRLTGETLYYIERQNLAQVRGKRVELFDKKDNRLRTQFLDFNTKDSIGTFYHGGSMVDSTGNVLESLVGNYFSKEKLFTFERRVEMKTDSVVLIADTIHYRTDTNIASFYGNVHAWHTDGYLRSSRGRYERNSEYFHFRRNVYVKGDDQEIWADTLNYDRINDRGSLFGNIQILDTVHSVILLGDEGHFQNQPQRMRLTRNPALVAYKVDENELDTLFARADTMLYYTVPKYKADSLEVVRAEVRLRYLSPHPVTSDTASKSIQDTLSLRQRRTSTTVDSPAISLPTSPPTDTTKSRFMDVGQTLTRAAPKPAVDTAAVDAIAVDSTAMVTTAIDTTAIRFLYAWRNVKMYRSNGQGICDSLVYNTIDSTARLYGDPVLWNENNQFSADSIQFFLPDNQISRADLFSSAFIISQEEPLLFNQIRGKDMIGYFHDNDIYRFDVIGSAEAIFCVKEDSLVITSLNRKESKEMTITLKQRKIQRVTYRENIKSNVFPLYELTNDERKLNNFKWREDERPNDRYSITSRSIIPSAVGQYQRIIQPNFPYTHQFFPGHIKPKPQKAKIEEDPFSSAPQIPFFPSDTLVSPPLQLPVIDSAYLSRMMNTLKRDSLPPPKALPPVIDSAQHKTTHLPDVSTPPVQVQHPQETQALTKKELHAQRKIQRKEEAALKKAERKKRRAEKKAEREERKANHKKGKFIALVWQ
jgi:lipopolysaccharide export system protein LptA